MSRAAPDLLSSSEPGKESALSVLAPSRSSNSAPTPALYIVGSEVVPSHRFLIGTKLFNLQEVKFPSSEVLLFFYSFPKAPLRVSPSRNVLQQSQP